MVAIERRSRRTGLSEPLHKFAANQFVALGREHRLLPLIRGRLSAAHVARLGLKFLHGPMTGFELAPGAVWGESDHLLKLLGLYEQPLLTAMAVGGPWRRFYNVSAADGFYGAGMRTAGLAEASICREMEAASRILIAQTARLNEAALIARACKRFDVSFINDCMKDLTGVDELRACLDDERWLLCSEAREAMMRWMVLKPKW